MNGHSGTLLDYTSRLESFRKSDSERDALVTELLQKFEELQLKYTEKVDDYNNEVESRRMWQTKARTSELALTQHKQVSSGNNFALAIIDGDGAVFQDYLLAQGKDGGSDAAHQLHTELRNHLRATYPDSNVADWSIVVHVVLNMQGLGTKLQACGVLSNPNELVAFGRAFSLAQPLFSFIDVGGGKERADHKVRETLRLWMPNAQCKHVFFGPCHDNGYLPVLEPYRLDRESAARLTLIEATPAEPGFQQLGLQRIRCPRVFRTESLPAKPNGMPQYQPNMPTLPNGMTSQFQAPLPKRTNTGMSANAGSFTPAPAPPKHSSSPSPAPSAESGASNTWAAVGKSGSTTGNVNIASKKAATRKFIFINLYDERLDEKLPEPQQVAKKNFDAHTTRYGNLCNSYHLLGKCDVGEYCEYHHGERLSPGEHLVLKHKARSLPCQNRLACRDFRCHLGHNCKHGDQCFWADKCRLKDTHGMDVIEAKRVYEDGSEEWLPSYLEKYRKVRS